MDTKTLLVIGILVYVLFLHKPSKTVIVKNTASVPIPKVTNSAAMPSTSQILAGAAAKAAPGIAKSLGSFLSNLGSDDSGSAADNDDMPSDDDSDDDDS